jgi:hypothetical protein
MLTHGFLLVPDNGADDSFWKQPDPAAPSTIELPDDLVVYLWDSLDWIQTSNPSKPAEWRGFGLNMHGPTVIRHGQAAKLAFVLRSWASLFASGPEKLKLKGAFTWIHGESIERGNHEYFYLSRAAVVEQLQQLASLADQAADGTMYLLHRGV